MTLGPIYYKASANKGPLQSGKPVIIDRWDHRLCCCTTRPLFRISVVTSVTFCVAWWFDVRNSAAGSYNDLDYRMFGTDSNDVIDAAWWAAAEERGVSHSATTARREEPGSTDVEFQRRLAARITLDTTGKFAFKIGGRLTTYYPDNVDYSGYVEFLYAKMLSFTGEQVDSGYSSGNGLIVENGHRFEFDGTIERSGLTTMHEYLFRINWAEISVPYEV